MLPRLPIPLAAIILATEALSLFSCAPPVRYDLPKEWIVPGAQTAVIESYRPALTGRRIFLDPGHGGEDRYNEGPSGKAVEADVNLYVALDLRSLLQNAGAIVFMSRDKDSTVWLRDRARLAVAAGAEIFISIHHNDTGSRDNVTNYTSVFYHSLEGRPDYFPANHDLARYIERDMAYAMRNPAPPSSPTFDGTLSDFMIYPSAGFAVLRDNPLPAVLIEGSFFSHPYEEMKLALREFNEIEAWGIFVGLGKYFRAGIPELKMLSDTVQSVARPALKVLAGPRGDIDRKSITAWIDSIPMPTLIEDSVGVVTVDPSVELTSGVHLVRIDLRNQRGNSSWPFISQLKVMLPIATLSLSAQPTSLPPDAKARTRIFCAAYDRQGRPVADGSAIHFAVDGRIPDTLITTVDGTSTLDIHPPDAPGMISVGVATESRKDSLVIPVRTVPEMSFIDGWIRSAPDSVPIPGSVVRYAPVRMPDSSRILGSSDRDGRFFAYQVLPDSAMLIASATGYFTQMSVLGFPKQFVTCDVPLTPVGNGDLFGSRILIDARFGGSESGDAGGTFRASDMNLTIAKRLQLLLNAAGAVTILVRDHDTTISEHDRAVFSGRYGRGTYVRIDASGPAGQCASEIYSNASNKYLAGCILGWVHRATDLDSATIFGGETPFYREVAQATITIIVPSVSTGYYDSATEVRIDEIAWGMFLGFLAESGFSGCHPQKFQVLDPMTKAPLGNTLVVMGGVLPRITNSRGIADFFGFVQHESDVSAPAHHAIQLIPISQ